MQKVWLTILLLTIIVVAIGIVSISGTFASIVTLVIGGLVGFLNPKNDERRMILAVVLTAAIIVFFFVGLSPSPGWTLTNFFLGLPIMWFVKKLA